jgi:hypothetical protein
VLFKMVQLPSDEPVQFVGVYVLKWGRVDEPTVAFREATPEEIAAEHNVERTATHTEDCAINIGMLGECDCGAE